MVSECASAAHGAGDLRLAGRNGLTTIVRIVGGTAESAGRGAYASAP